jgi:hypothetical protein
MYPGFLPTFEEFLPPCNAAKFPDQTIFSGKSKNPENLERISEGGLGEGGQKKT